MPNGKVIWTGDDYVLTDDGGPLWPYELGTENGTERLCLDRDEAVEVARAILNNENEPTSVKASKVSFNEGLLRLAAVHERVVTFRYAKGDGRVIETRSLVPTEVKEVGDHLTFVGYDPDREQPRAYRVDRMVGEVSVA